MVTRQQAQEKWANNWLRSISRIAGASGDVDEYARGVADYLGVGGVDTAEDLVNSASDDAQEAVQTLVNQYQANAETPSASEIREALVENSDANSVEGALSNFAQDWDNNYAAAFGQ